MSWTYQRNRKKANEAVWIMDRMESKNESWAEARLGRDLSVYKPFHCHVVEFPFILNATKCHWRIFTAAVASYGLF